MENEKIIEVKEGVFPALNREELARIIYDDESVEAMWERVSAAYSETCAISDLNENYSYARLKKDVACFRGALASKGVKKGDFVGVFIPNSYDFVKVFLAVVTSGAVAVLIPPQLDEKTVYGMSAKFSFSALVYGEQLAEKVKLASALPFPLIMAEEEGKEAPSIKCRQSDPCAVLFTGGTTGKSKGVLLSHGAILQGTQNGCYGVKGLLGERYLIVLPLTHVFGLIRNMLTVLYTGSTLRICRNPKDMFREMAVFKPTYLILVPALAEMGLNLSRQMKLGAKLFGGELRYIICGASATPPHLIKEYKAIGVTLLQGYGLTESANLVSGNPNSLEKPESVGFPYPNQSLRIVNGELWIKGKNLMTCYLDEEENKMAFEDGWFKTGDLARIDDEGYIYIVGRIKEVIVLDSGEKVSPAEVEFAFCTPDYISDAMVYDERSESGRQILVLEVVLRPGFGVSKDVAKAELDKINAALPSYERVSKIIIRDEDFPRSPSMKKIRKGN